MSRTRWVAVSRSPAVAAVAFAPVGRPGGARPALNDRGVLSAGRAKWGAAQPRPVRASAAALLALLLWVGEVAALALLDPRSRIEGLTGGRTRLGVVLRSPVGGTAAAVALPRFGRSVHAVAGVAVVLALLLLVPRSMVGGVERG